MLSGTVDNPDEYHYFHLKSIHRSEKKQTVVSRIAISDNKIITNIVPHGPASIAGPAGDKIQRIDGKSVDKWRETFAIQ